MGRVLESLMVALVLVLLLPCAAMGSSHHHHAKRGKHSRLKDHATSHGHASVVRKLSYVDSTASSTSPKTSTLTSSNHTTTLRLSLDSVAASKDCCRDLASTRVMPSSKSAIVNGGRESADKSIDTNDASFNGELGDAGGVSIAPRKMKGTLQDHGDTSADMDSAGLPEDHDHEREADMEAADWRPVKGDTRSEHGHNNGTKKKKKAPMKNLEQKPQ